MAKGKSKFNEGAGHYSQNDVTFHRPRHIDASGNVKAKKRDLSGVVEHVSGMGGSRPVHKPAAKRYGP